MMERVDRVVAKVRAVQKKVSRRMHATEHEEVMGSATDPLLS